MKIRKIITPLVIATALSGCGKTIPEAAHDYARLASTAVRVAEKGPPRRSAGTAFYPTSPWLGVMVHTSPDHSGLPAACDSITYEASGPVTLNDLAQWITTHVGIPVEINGGQSQINGRPVFANTIPTVDSAGTHAFPFRGRPLISAAGGAGAGYAGGATFEPDFTGSCTKLLNQVAAQFNIAWRYRNGVLSFDRYVTRTFSIAASSPSSQASANISTNGSSQTTTAGAVGTSQSGGTSSAGETSSVHAKINVWTDVRSAMKMLLRSKDHYSIQQSSGTVTVRSTPSRMRQVAAWFRQENAILGINVYVQVSAIYVNVSRDDNYGLNLDALWQAGLRGGYQLATAGVVPTLAEAAGTGSFAILAPPAGGHQSHFSDTKVFLNALASDDRYAELKTGNAICQNTAMTPLSVTTDQNIVQSIAFNTVAQAGTSSSSATATTINYGFSLQIMPRVVSPNIVNLFFTFNNSDLSSLTNYSLGTSGSLELATIDKRSLWNHVTVASGDTIVVAGSEQDRVERGQQGTGSPGNWLLGGQDTGKITRTRLILLITPTILPSPDSPLMTGASLQPVSAGAL